MALEIFTHAPALLPIAEILEAQRSPGLVLARATRHGLCGTLELSGGMHGRSLVTETLRLAAAGHRLLGAVHETPDRRLDDFVREIRTGDAELMIFLEGR